VVSLNFTGGESGWRGVELDWQGRRSPLSPKTAKDLIGDWWEKEEKKKKNTYPIISVMEKSVLADHRCYEFFWRIPEIVGLSLALRG